MSLDAPSLSPDAPAFNSAAPPVARPHLNERPDYLPRSTQEQLMVPVLARAIRVRLATSMPAIRTGDRALDVGCGRQPFRRELERLGLDYRGLDTQQNADCPVDIVAAIDTPMPEDLRRVAPVRFILCTEVLEHVADWDAAFSNFHDLLGSGGRLLITAPFFYPLHEQPFDFWRPTIHAIEHFARRHGLRVIECAKAGDPWDVIGTAAGSIRPMPRKRGITSWAAGMTAKVVKRAVFHASLSPWVRGRVELQGEIYPSNVAVLEKP